MPRTTPCLKLISGRVRPIRPLAILIPNGRKMLYNRFIRQRKRGRNVNISKTETQCDIRHSFAQLSRSISMTSGRSLKRHSCRVQQIRLRRSLFFLIAKSNFWNSLTSTFISIFNWKRITYSYSNFLIHWFSCIVLMYRLDFDLTPEWIAELNFSFIYYSYIFGSRDNTAAAQISTFLLILAETSSPT